MDCTCDRITLALEVCAEEYSFKTRGLQAKFLAFGELTGVEEV